MNTKPIENTPANTSPNDRKEGYQPNRQSTPVVPGTEHRPEDNKSEQPKQDESVKGFNK